MPANKPDTPKPPKEPKAPAEEPKAEEPKAPAEEPKAEEPKVEEPKAEEPKAPAEEPKAEKKRHKVLSSDAFRQQYLATAPPPPKDKKHEKALKKAKGKKFSQLTKEQKDSLLEAVAVQLGLLDPEDDDEES